MKQDNFIASPPADQMVGRHSKVAEFLKRIEQVTIDGAPYFSLVDIGMELGYKRTSLPTLIDRLPDQNYQKTLLLRGVRGERYTIVVPMEALIELIISSRLKTCTQKTLKKWIINQTARAFGRHMM